ncbi:MAG TPA: hypothetical protein VEV16_07465 [Daejeonella sp.]|nr:hypothetical protein [Daejeonella sp.]
MGKIWLAEPEKHDFPAALDYLELLYPIAEVRQILKKLKKTATIKKKAKDILRACELSLLPKDNSEVQSKINEVKKGKKLSPVLLVRKDDKLIIADGYHRICAAYYLSEVLEVPCRLV